MFRKRHWIPPAGLLFAQLSHGFSWLLALWISLRAGIESVSFPEIAWIHVVALGWFTVAALSILLHAIPAFVDVTWRFERVARTAVAVLAASIVAFVASLLFYPQALGAVASLLAGGFAVYATTAWLTLGRAFGSPDRIDRAVARAFAITLLVLAVAVALGLALSWWLAGAIVPAWFARLPSAHGNLALFGWLTLLVYGVSARTLRPIAGERSRWRLLHVVVGSATLLGALVLAGGLGLDAMWLAWAGGVLVAVGAACYIVDVADILRRANVPHRVPQAFVAAALCWLSLSLLVGTGVLAGKPWQAAFGFLMLGGWIAQMVNGHLFHIGVRLIATIYRGEEDETEPRELLDARLSWTAFIAMQSAVAAIAIGLLSESSQLCAAGAALGLLGWLAMTFALLQARVLARRSA